MSDYKYYNSGTRIRVKNTGETGEAFESALGFVSVFLDSDGETAKARYFEMNEIEFLNEEISKSSEAQTG